MTGILDLGGVPAAVLLSSPLVGEDQGEGAPLSSPLQGEVGWGAPLSSPLVGEDKGEGAPHAF